MRLALGTAQFGMPYGISNKIGQTSVSNAQKILQMAFSNNINTLDTAVAYGNCELILGESDVKNWEIFSKLPSVPARTADVSEWVIDQVYGSLKRLNVNAIEGVLLHDPQQILSPFGRGIVTGLQTLKSIGLVKKVGYSIYSPDILSRLLEVMTPDVVQLPLNVFDQRFLTSGSLNKLNNLNIEVHARSVFLQGLLLMERHDRPLYFNKWIDLFERWDATLDGKQNRLSICFGFIQSIDCLSRVVVGVESPKQLSQLLDAWNATSPISVPHLACEDQALVHPFEWKL